MLRSDGIPRKFDFGQEIGAGGPTVRLSDVREVLSVGNSVNISFMKRRFHRIDEARPTNTRISSFLFEKRPEHDGVSKAKSHRS